MKRLPPKFVARMDAAAALFRSGAAPVLLCSGSVSEGVADEPASMREALLERGVPDEAIVEVPGYVDKNGINIPQLEALPRGCAARDDDLSASGRSLCGAVDAGTGPA